MLTLFLLLINLTTIFIGIYQFDYMIDNQVNNIFVILLSILIGTIMMILSALIYIEVTYQIVIKRGSIKSKLKHMFANTLGSVPIHLFRMKVKVIGKENLPSTTSFTVYANHTEYLDTPVIKYNLKKYPLAFLQKQSVETFPIIGKWTTKFGCVSLDRTNPRKGAISIKKTIENVKSGVPMAIYPEGTTGKVIGEMADFKPGAFKVALKSKAPLLPISIVKPKHYNKIKWPFKKPVTLVIHKPLQFHEFQSLSTIELSDVVRNIISEPLNKYNEM